MRRLRPQPPPGGSISRGPRRSESTQARRCFEVSSSPVVRQYNTIVMLGDLYADELVTHIAHDGRNISLERVSVTTAAG